MSQISLLVYAIKVIYAYISFRNFFHLFFGEETVNYSFVLLSDLEKTFLNILTTTTTTKRKCFVMRNVIVIELVHLL